MARKSKPWAVILRTPGQPIRTEHTRSAVADSDLPNFDGCGSGCHPDNKPWPHTMVWGNCANAVQRYDGPRPVIVEEHGHLMSGGGVNVWPDDPEILDIYPLAKRIEHGKKHGGRVLRRRVIVVDEWEEV